MTLVSNDHLNRLTLLVTYGIVILGYNELDFPLRVFPKWDRADCRNSKSGVRLITERLSPTPIYACISTGF